MRSVLRFCRIYARLFPHELMEMDACLPILPHGIWFQQHTLWFEWGQLAPTLLSIIVTAQSELHGRLARPHENFGRLATDI